MPCDMPRTCRIAARASPRRRGGHRQEVAADLGRGLLSEDGEGGAHPALGDEGLEGEEEHGGPEVGGADRQDPGGDGQDASQHRHEHLDVAALPLQPPREAVAHQPPAKGRERAAAGDDGSVDDAEDGLLIGKTRAEIWRGPASDGISGAEAETRSEQDELDGSGASHSAHRMAYFEE